MRANCILPEDWRRCFLKTGCWWNHRNSRQNLLTQTQGCPVLVTQEVFSIFPTVFNSKKQGDPKRAYEFRLRIKRGRAHWSTLLRCGIDDKGVSKYHHQCSHPKLVVLLPDTLFKQDLVPMVGALSQWCVWPTNVRTCVQNPSTRVQRQVPVSSPVGRTG